MPLTQLFAFIVFVSLFIAALWRPIFGILGYLAVYLIWNPRIWWGVGLRQYFSKPSFIAMVFLIIGSVIHSKELNWSFTRREIEFYVFLGLIWISSFVFGVGVDRLNQYYLTKMTKLFVFIFLFIRVVNSLDDYKMVVWMIILSAIFMSYQAHTVSTSYFSCGRLDGFIGGLDFHEANGFSVFLALAMIFLSIEMLRVSWLKKSIFVFGIALILDTVILTQSRSVFLGLFLTVPYIIFRSPSEYRKYLYSFLTLGIVLFFMLSNVEFINRLKTISTELQIDQEEIMKKEKINRLDFWKASVEMFKDHPFGVGVRNFQFLVRDYDHRNPGMDAHNTYVLCYTEIGILGIVLFLIIIAEALLQLKRIRLMAMHTKLDKEITLYSFALVIVMIMYLTGYMMTHSNLYTEVLWILLSMPICLENAARELLVNSHNPAVTTGDEN